MNLINYLLIGAVLLILGGAARYVLRAKKKGAGCIGCPDSGKCGGNCGSCTCCRK